MSSKTSKTCNKILNERKFPDHWKTGETILIHKANKPKDQPQSYRPITLLNHLSKIAKKTIAERLKKTLNEGNILPKEQFGFVEKHSTPTVTNYRIYK